MKMKKLSIAAIVIVAGLATAVLGVTSLPSVAADAEVAVPGTAAEHTAEAAKYEQEAGELDVKADKHTRLAGQYRARVSGGGKQASGLKSLGKHCESIAKAYSTAATEAREMAKMHREMAAAG